MRYLRALLCLLFVVFSLVSCKKKDDFILISGKLIDPKQNINISGVRVELWAQKIESGIYSAYYDSYGSQLSNSSGEFSFELENNTFASVKLSFSKDNYYFWEYEIDGDVLKNVLFHDETYQMQPKAWIKLLVKNENPVDGSDYFDLRIMNGLTQCEECCTNEVLKFQGADVDEEIICQLLGHEDISIRWNSRKGAIQKGDVKLIFVPAFDTTSIQLFY